MVVVVTGGSRGIGKAVCEKFAKFGHTVIVNYAKNVTLAQDLAKKIGGEAYQADVADYASVCAMRDYVIKKYGRVDVLVNNAGIALPQKVLVDVTEEEFDRVVAVNLKGVFNCCKAFFGDLISSCGAVVNLSSVWGQKPASCEVVYSATKGAIDSFTVSLAEELSLSGVRVNAVSPGLVDTQMNAHLSKEDIDDFVKTTPIGRIIQTEEVAEKIYDVAIGKDTGKIITIY